MIQIQALGALCAVLALIAGAGWLAKRSPALIAARTESGGLRLRGTLALGARRRLHLVETEHGAALILTGGAQDQMVVLQ